MYSATGMPGTLDGIETINFMMYWNAIKDKLADLQQLPIWATNHAMKLGITVTNLRAKGRHDLVDLLQDEINKVNSDIAKAWKVKGYIDTYLPDWMNAATTSDAPIVPIAAAASSSIMAESNPTPLDLETMRRAGVVPTYQNPNLVRELQGWVKALFGSGGTVQGNSGLGALPLLLGAAALAALAYVVTTGMSLWQDYVTKKDLTQNIIEGKLTSGQASDILVSTRPSEGAFSNVLQQVTSGVGTTAILVGLGGLAFLYFTRSK
jgi:hypothetical protein